MMLKTSTEWIALISLLMGCATTIVGFFLWYSSTVKKRYAASRDFEHLKNNYHQLAANLESFAEESEKNHQHLLTELVQIKSLMMAVLAKSGDSISSILRGKE